ncbi:hypothetical protein VB796_01225 [Arcicella sp. LKC2W]|uniref:hypothetical protein n=1 Tax=Arcicella sp. LKC2W TaxID=2984198 RepID=UPI002B1ECC4B|nr:hypothetical protein [Arcicella sp. LKC2W]MEA5457637.1 hypothetical protein [Arcicella sp. LKC2W]
MSKTTTAIVDSRGKIALRLFSYNELDTNTQAQDTVLRSLEFVCFFYLQSWYYLLKSLQKTQLFDSEKCFKSLLRSLKYRFKSCIRVSYQLHLTDFSTG